MSEYDAASRAEAAEAAGPEPRGDAADQATDLIFAAEQEAIRAALSGRPTGADDSPEVRLTRHADEPVLDFGDGDDSDDPAHAGGDDVALDEAGAPRDPDDGVPDGVEVVDDLTRQPGTAT